MTHPDLFTLAIELRDQRIAELEHERNEMLITLASVLGYMRAHKIGHGHYGMGVRNMIKTTLKVAA